MKLYNFFLKHRKVWLKEALRLIPWLFFGELVIVQICLLMMYYTDRTSHIIWINTHIFLMILKSMPILILAVMLHGGWVLWDKENKQNRSDK